MPNPAQAYLDQKMTNESKSPSVNSLDFLSERGLPDRMKLLIDAASSRRWSARIGVPDKAAWRDFRNVVRAISFLWLSGSVW